MKASKVVEWVAAIAIGIVAIAVVLNQTNVLHSTHNKVTYSASANAYAIDALAHQILAQMSQDDKVGQLIIPMPFNDTSMDAGGGDMRSLLTQYHVGGIFIPAYSMTAQQLHDYIAQMQAASKIPLIISSDFEGGGWNTLSNEVGARPSPWVVGQSGDTQQAYDKGVGDAKLLRQLGLNVNFAPVVDVLTNPTNPILQGRTFGSTPDLVSKMAASYIDGLKNGGGIAATLKHFPGLGASTVDPHQALPTVDRTLAQLQSVDLVPYKMLIASGRVSMIMTTHMLIPSLDPNLPTSISPAVINGLLRHDLGYDGVVVSDALFMGGLSNKYSIPQAGLLAFEAGTDLLLGATGAGDTLTTINLIKSALSKGQITQQYLDNAVLRILRFKIQWKIIPSSFKLASATGANSAGSAMVVAPAAQIAFAADQRRHAI
jgi:beta-N-acetylhexosaminidase